jgi:hypothetical protein
MMGRVWSVDAVWDLWAMSKYGTVTSLAESPLVDGLIYAGTDDGLIQVSEDGGESWRRIASLPGVADGFFVNDIKADLHAADTVYAVVDQHKRGDFAPYVLRSTNRGASWSSIAGDLPERHIAWRIVQDHVDPALLFLGTEFGVFFSPDAGAHWVELTGGVPDIPFRDLAIQRRENDLVGATFGRGFFVLDDYSALRGMSKERLEREAELFPVRDAWWYIPRRPLGGTGKASQGAAFFLAPNPPFGAVFTYYLKDELVTREKARKEKEKEAAEEGGDTPYPGWEALREEELEDEPSIVLTVRDAEDRIVRRLNGPVEAGFHRVAWDLRYPAPDPWSPKKEEEPDFEDDSSGFLAVPGTYTVQLAKRVEGRLVDLGERHSFVVKPLSTGTLEGASPEQVVEFTRQVDALRRDVGAAAAAIGETLTRLTGIKEALMRSTVQDVSLDDTARDLERRLEQLRERLSGNERRENFGDPGPVSITRRLEVATMGNRLSTYGPTPTHRESFAIARREFDALAKELGRILDDELPALERRLDEAGVPWTPGRGVPQTKR